MAYLQTDNLKTLKKLLFYITICLLFSSCEKSPELLIPSSEVPKWLKERISDDEKTIESNPQSGLDVAAWIRYEYDGNFYFEYVNLLSSAGPKIYKYDGKEFVYNDNNFSNCQSGKCCRSYVWKGPSYIDLYD